MKYQSEIERSVRPYEPTDRDALREFQRVHFGPDSRQVDDTFFRWVFEWNPDRLPERPSLWVCARDGVIVGQFGSLPVRLKVGDEECHAAWVIDWMVDPAWRLKGVGPALLAAYMRTTDIMLGLVFEKAAAQSFLKTGWRNGGNLSLFVRPLDPQACAEGLGAPELVARLTPRVPVVASAYVAARAVQIFTRLSLDRIASFDDRVDQIWKSARQDYGILVRRDFAYVRWRFDDMPYGDAYQRYYLKRGSEVLGYAVLKLDRWREHHLAARVVDYLVERQHLRRLLALLIDEARRQGAAALFLERMDAASEKSLRSLGCLRVRAADQFMLNVREDAPAAARDAMDVAKWFISLADSDADHIALEAQRKASGRREPEFSSA